MKIQKCVLLALAVTAAVARGASPDGGVAAPPDGGVAAPPARFTLAERSMLQKIAADVSNRLRDAAFPADRPVAILPMAGDDRGNYVKSLLKNAVTQSGRVCLEGRDDPMWNQIVSEINWSVLKEKTEELDPSTMTAFGRLKTVRVLVYGRLDVFRDKKGVTRAVELSLHASDVLTREHVWGETFRGERSWHPDNRVTVIDAPAADLAVFVSAEFQDDDASDLASEILSVARETVGAQGFQIAPEAANADVSLQLSVGKSVFDRTGNYAVMEGSVRAIATVPARKGFYLGETRIDRERGERRLGDRDAMLSVRDAIRPKLVSWIGQNVTVEKTGLSAVKIRCDVSALDPDTAAAFVSGFCRDVAAIAGVARCALDSQTEDNAVFFVSYLPDKIPEGPVNAIRTRHPDYFADDGIEL